MTRRDRLRRRLRFYRAMMRHEDRRQQTARQTSRVVVGIERRMRPNQRGDR